MSERERESLSTKKLECATHVGDPLAPRPGRPPGAPARPRPPKGRSTNLLTQCHTQLILPHSIALATKDGSSLLLFPVALAAAPQPNAPPRPAARAGAGTASWMAFQTVEPLRSEEHGQR